MNLPRFSKVNSYTHIFSVYIPAVPIGLVSVLLATYSAARESYFSASFFMAVPIVMQGISSFVGMILFDGISNSVKSFWHISFRVTGFLSCLLIFLNEGVGYLSTFFFIVMCLSLSLDQFMTSSAAILLRDEMGVRVREFTAVGTIIGRGVYAVSPLLAVFLMKNSDNLFSGFMLMALTLCFFLVSLLYPFYLKSFCDTEPEAKKVKDTGGDNIFLFHIFFLFLTNLSTGAIYFLLVTGGEEGVKGSSILYMGLLLMQLAIIFSPGVVPQFKGVAGPLLPYLFLSLVTCLVYLNIQGYLGYMIFILMGIFYGMTLPAFSEYTMRELKKDAIYRALGIGRIAGRISSVVAVSVAGVMVSSGFSHDELLLFCGFLGVASTIFLWLLRNSRFSVNAK